jgi:dolichol-phosphate mannosyltransferase
VKLSIVIPFYNEEQNVAPVLNEVRRFYPQAQLIAVDDCSADGTYRAIAAQPGVQADRLARHMGQSAAIYRGLTQAHGDVCVILDGDGQSNPADIKLLLEHFPAYDFVNGDRVNRSDSLNRVLASRIANTIRNFFTRDGMRDTGGTPKAMKQECVAHLVPFDGFHRYIPALLHNAGFRLLEVPVSHRERMYGLTKYTNMGRAVRGIRDLFGVRWLLRRQISAKAPARECYAPPSTPRTSGCDIDAEESAHQATSGVSNAANNPPQIALKPMNE